LVVVVGLEMEAVEVVEDVDVKMMQWCGAE
jgi:hypothetical protein